MSTNKRAILDFVAELSDLVESLKNDLETNKTEKTNSNSTIMDNFINNLEKLIIKHRE